MKTGNNAENISKAFYTPEQLADFLCISKPTVYRLVCKRRLPFHKIGGALRFKREDIERYLEEGRIEPVM